MKQACQAATKGTIYRFASSMSGVKVNQRLALQSIDIQ